MPSVDPHVIIRMGSHAEKHYVEKTAKRLDGIIVGANLVEATPGATASLLAKRLARPYYIDPMTYAFACDVDWIKSDQKKKRDGEVTTVRAFKRSYRSLADRLGGVFRETITESVPVEPEDLAAEQAAVKCCESVSEYQLRRVRDEFERDEEYKQFAEDVAGPAAVFAPYFYIDRPAWLDLVLHLSSITAALDLGTAVHTVICADVKMLQDNDFRKRIVNELPKTGVDGVWLRFMRLSEYDASEEELQALKALVEGLSTNIEVYNMHGGYFSLALCKYGLSGVSHGVGYGEQKYLQPIIGVTTPTVRYYLPDVRKRFGVPDIERCFKELGITNVEEFQSKVCDCVVCKGVVSKRLSDFHKFGDKHYASKDSKRKSQTPAAAKRCRFHFLLNRIKERDSLGSMTLRDICGNLDKAIKKWAGHVWLQSSCAHMKRWKHVLQPKTQPQEPAP